jgi:glycosyltransferase involved in cell wall biosynthesis
LSWLYKTTLKHAEAVFVLNRDDPVELVRQRILTDTHKIKRLNGIGVDLSYYQAPPPSPNRLIFVMVARLVREKGVAVYVAAAEKVKLVYPQARFLLVGGTDSSRDCITHEELSEWQSRGAIEYGGRVKDVRPFYSAGSVVVLPSWYREGLPRTLLEGLAAGRAIITTDSPGCREAVEHGYNGFLVEPRSTESLVNAMMSFVRKPELISEMGRHSRELAERKFDVRAVNAEILTAMDLLGTANQASYEVRSEFGESLQ